MTIDFSLVDHGSIVLLRPHTDAARDWVADNIGCSAEWAGGIVIEPRYVTSIVYGMEEAGLQEGEPS